VDFSRLATVAAPPEIHRLRPIAQIVTQDHLRTSVSNVTDLDLHPAMD